MTSPDIFSFQGRLRSRWWRIALALSLAAYFVWMNWDSLSVHFALDDLANLHHYFEYSPRQLVLSNFLPWRGDYRPFAGLFYMPVYRFAGLNPAPYQAVLLAILLANVYWAYRFARLLGTGELAASLVALAVCYHVGLANLYYNAAFVFDALSCFFYLASFGFYLRIRNRGRQLDLGETAVFLAILLCALNSKEMAVSVPVMLLVYEWVYHPPAARKVAALKAWLSEEGRVCLAATGLTMLDIYGKVAGPGAMIRDGNYRPIFTLARFHDFQVAQLQDLFFSWDWTPGWGTILGAWVLLGYLAWRRAGRPVLRFLFWYLAVVALPIEFLEGRREGCLILLMVGGAIFLAVVFEDGVKAAAGYFSREFQFPASYPFLAGAMAAIAVLVWVHDQRQLKASSARPVMAALGRETWDLIEQFRRSSFRPASGSSVAFLDDPLHNSDMYGLARLWLHDRSIVVHVPSQGSLTPQDLGKVDAVFTVENRRIVRVR